MTWSPSEPKRVTACTPLDSRGPKRLWSTGPGWVKRDRPAAGGTRPLEFCCPVHGRFTVDVPRGEDPDAVACPTPDLDWPVAGGGYLSCDLSSPWSPSTFGLWKSAGEVTE